nr:sigma-70 family RNA polymerase sigma factor [Actinophytocola xanthii]
MDDPSPEDRLLLERLRAGEDAAFGELFSRHSTAVYRLAVGLVNDRAEAEDLTAEAFFRVLQAIRRGSGPVDNVRGYLLIVARRVAWEWSLRRRDVPVSDEELTHRAPSDPDATGVLTERNLIRRAFTSLPERWRNVLWKMEVEGERPAAVALNFGLSPNATAALARRARQGLRAAYLQAHLAADRSATGCRSVLEKLGAYTAGSTSGIEYRRIRAHLSTCASCTAMYAELRDVCSGLRAHAAYIALPATVAVGAAAAQLAGGTTATGTAGAASAGLGGSIGTGLGAAVKGLLATTKIQVGIAAGSAAAIGAMGIVTIAWGGDGASSPTGLSSEGAVRLEVTDPPPSPLTSTSLHLAEGELSSHASVAPGERDGGPAVPAPRQGGSSPTSSSPTVAPTSGADLTASTLGAPAGYDDTVPVLSRETTVERYTQVEDGVVMVYETTTVTEVNSLDQTRTSTQTTSFAEPPASETPDSSAGSTGPSEPSSTPSSVPTPTPSSTQSPKNSASPDGGS